MFSPHTFTCGELFFHVIIFLKAMKAHFMKTRHTKEKKRGSGTDMVKHELRVTSYELKA